MTTPETDEPRGKPYRRKKKLVKPLLQFRFAAMFFSVAAIAVMFQAVLQIHALNKLAKELPGDGAYVLERIPSLVAPNLLVTFFLLMGLILATGIVFTFRLAGPMYRIEQHLTKVLAGEAAGPCTLRTGDELQGMCVLINRLIERAGEASADSRGEQELAAKTPGKAKAAA